MTKIYYMMSGDANSNYEALIQDEMSIINEDLEKAKSYTDKNTRLYK